MRKIVFSLCMAVCAIFAAIVLHKLLSLYSCSRIYDKKEAFAQTLFDKDNAALAAYARNSEKTFDLCLSNSKNAVSDFLSAAQKIQGDEISKEEMRGLLEVYKNSVFKDENAAGIKKFYFDFLDSLSVNKNEFSLAFAREFGSENPNLVSENANALSANMDFYLFDFYNAASYESQMETIALAFINSMNSLFKDRGVSFAMKPKEKITHEDRIYNCIECLVLYPQKKSDIQNFSKSFADAVEASLKKAKEAFSLNVESDISQKLSKLHDKAYKRIIGIYLK